MSIFFLFVSFSVIGSPPLSRFCPWDGILAGIKRFTAKGGRDWVAEAIDDSPGGFALAWLRGRDLFAGGKDVGISVVVDRKSLLAAKDEHLNIHDKG
jgi:hypothetical protein